MVKRKKKRGFTLIEVMVVVAMIILLAGVMVPKFSGYIQEVKKTEIVNQARSLIMAVEAVNIKRSGTVSSTDTASIAVDKIQKVNKDLIESDMVDKIKSVNISTCRQIIDTEKYEVQLNGDVFEKVVEISSTR